MHILVTTPTGHIGGRIVETLLPTEHRLTLFARDPSRLPPDARAGARVVQGSLHEPERVFEALEGADAAFFLIPPSALRDALLQAGLPPLTAHGYEEMMGGVSRHLDAGDYQSEPHTPQSTGVVDFRTFAEQMLRPAFEAQFAGA